MPDETGLEILDDTECRRLLATTPIGRVAFVADGAPLALPVNYRWFQDSVVFRSLEGQKLHAAALSQRVSFEIDGWNEHDHAGWSVLVKGTANEVTAWAEREELEQLDLVPWSNGRWRECWVRITPDEITGRRFA